MDCSHHHVHSPSLASLPSLHSQIHQIDTISEQTTYLPYIQLQEDWQHDGC